MNENYKKVVNLQGMGAPTAAPTPAPQRPEQSWRRPENKEEIEKKKAAKSRAEDIDKVFAPTNTGPAMDDILRINRPAEINQKLVYLGYFVVMLIIAFGSIYLYNFLMHKKGEDLAKQMPAEENVEKEGRWYAVRLVNNEVYYGFIHDTKSDPIVLERVYYDYDQVNKTDEAKETKEGEPKTESGSIRLVKRGKEAHGPDGSMDIVRSQALSFEPLAEDSKILKAILGYENK